MRENKENENEFDSYLYNTVNGSFVNIIPPQYLTLIDAQNICNEDREAERLWFWEHLLKHRRIPPS